MKRNLGVDIRFRSADGIESYGREVGDMETRSPFVGIRMRTKSGDSVGLDSSGLPSRLRASLCHLHGKESRMVKVTRLFPNGSRLPFDTSPI